MGRRGLLGETITFGLSMVYPEVMKLIRGRATFPYLVSGVWSGQCGLVDASMAKHGKALHLEYFKKNTRGTTKYGRGYAP